MEGDPFQQVGRIWVDEEKDLFPFEKEVSLFLFRTWVLWPEYGPRRTFTARLLAEIVTLQHYDGMLRPSRGRLKTLTELRERVAEPWFEEFYKHFVSQELVGGIDRLIDAGRTPRQQDEIIDKAIRVPTISLDMLTFLLRVRTQAPELAQVNIAAQFISLNGFKRPDLYDMRPGEREKTPGISYDKVYGNWKHSKPTLGLDFIITTQWKELASLRLSDQNFLLTLSRLVNDNRKVLTILAQYHWLLEFFKAKYPAISKVQHWPFLPDFKERQPVDIEPLTDEQLQIAKKADDELHPKRKCKDG